MIKKFNTKFSLVLQFLSFGDRCAEIAVKNISLYIIPIAFLIMTIVSFTQWNNFFEGKKERTLPLHVWVQTVDSTDVLLSDTARRVAASSPVDNFETKRNEKPVWISISTIGDFPAPKSSVIEFPSRHAVSMSCWDMETQKAIEGMKRVKAGFKLPIPDSSTQLLCRGEFIGPANLTANLWLPEELEKSEQYFHRSSGLLDGAMILLALFSLFTAWVNKKIIYVVFSSWLVMNMRLAEVSTGWDVLWLGYSIPPSWIYPTRALTISFYALLYVSIFTLLFKEDLKESVFKFGLKLVRVFCLLLIPAAVFLSYKNFLPVMWSLVGLTLIIMSVSLIKVVIYSTTRTSLWYAGAIGVSCLSSLIEVIAAAFGYREFSAIGNSVTAAMASSLLFAIAIAEHIRMEHVQNVETKAELQSMIKTMPIGLFTLDSCGRCISANPACFEIVKSSSMEFLEKAWKTHFADDTWFRLRELLDEAPDAEIEALSKCGEQRFMLRVAKQGGKIQCVLQDVTASTQATENLRYLANNDPLTKTFNRRGIAKLFTYAHDMLEQGQPIAFAYLDLDRFKLINDMLGHTVGDDVLTQVCSRITSLIPSGFFLGRVGGDEFVIIMPDTKITLAEVISRSIIQSLTKEAFKVGAQSFFVRCSIGLIEVTTDMSMEDAISSSDRACREAKKNQNDGLVIYVKDSDAFIARRDEILLIEELSSDHATGRLYIELQPILSLTNPYDSRNVEVLLRSRDNNGKSISAEKIIEAAETIGRTSVIDRWVLATTLSWVESNLSNLSNMQFCCVNLSVASLNEDNFSADIIQLLQQYPEAARRICFDITESVALLNTENVRHFINTMRRSGVKVALDNFGAGFTSLSYLNGITADVLKIDGRLIANMNHHASSICIVESIVNLASNLGMKTIAKWAEDTETVQTLMEIGVDYVQGFIISESRALDEILLIKSFEPIIASASLRELIFNIARRDEAVTEQAKLLDMRRYREKIVQLRLKNALSPSLT